MKPSQWVAGLTKFSVMVVELMLAARFAFRALNADSTRLFVSWLYENTEPMVTPFHNVLPVVRGDGFTVELPTLVAMVVWAFTAYVILAAVTYMRSNADAQVSKKKFRVSLRDRR